MFTFFAQGEAEQPMDRFKDVVETIPGDLGLFIPEIILCLGVCWLILVDLFMPLSRSRVLGYHAFAIVALATIALISSGISVAEPRSMFQNLLVNDGFGHFFKFLMFIGTLVCIPMVMMHRQFERRRMGEFYGLLVGALVGMCLMVSAKNLLTFYLGIEFASITCYLLTAYVKEDRFAAEGGLKYVIYGSVASGMMIYGLSLIYGLTGSLDINAVAQTLQVERAMDMTLIVAALLSFAGFAYKISAFPMHFWCPDVYEGAPLPFTAFLSVVSKVAGFAVLIRFIMPFTADGTWDLNLMRGATVHVNWPLIIGIAAAFSMTVGNLSALFQTNMKRLLAYSSIAHAGYLLMGVAALKTGDADFYGWTSIAFYLVVYMATNLGAFLIVSIISARSGDESVESFRGLGTRNTLFAVAMFFFLISLIGLPPTGGFAGKFQLLEAALKSDLIWLAIVAVINTAISVYYYARIIKLMFLEESEDKSPVVASGGATALVCMLLAPVIYLGIVVSGTVEFIRGLNLEMGG